VPERPEWVVAATVVRVIDADTVKLDLDLGFRVHLLANCRIADINAPELRTPAGERAKAYAETLLEPGDTL
jgi:micrococcal nuclease